MEMRAPHSKKKNEFKGIIKHTYKIYTMLTCFPPNFFCKQIPSTHSYMLVMVCVQTGKDVRCKAKIWDTLMSQKWSAQAEVLLTLYKQLGETTK